MKTGANCGKCPLRDQPYVPGSGGGQTLLMTDAPSAADVEGGRYFAGPAGESLRKLLGMAKIEFEACYRTALVKCHVPKSRASMKKAIERCRPAPEAEPGGRRKKCLQPSMGSSHVHKFIDLRVPSI